MPAATREPVPVVLLTGYLGAGKTTLMHHLLGLPEVRAQRPALLINEFGALGVDADRLRPAGFTVYEVNNGSLFCVCTRLPLVQALKQVAASADVGLLLVEATGVSETRDLEALLGLPTLAGRFRLQANLCLVDAAAFTAVVAFLGAVTSQVRAADGLVLNKADLVLPEELGRLGGLLATLNPRAPQASVRQGQVPWTFVAGLRHERPAEPAMAAPPRPFCSAALACGGEADRERFAAAIKALGGKLLRLKGHARFADGLRFVELAGGRFAERAALPGADATAFTAIGWQTTPAELAAAFADAFGEAGERVAAPTLPAGSPAGHGIGTRLGQEEGPSP